MAMMARSVKNADI